MANNAVSTRHVALDREACGAFKVPGLRNVALTAPYMHNGSLATLAEVVRHYSAINEEILAIAQSAPHTEPDDSFVRPPTGSVLRTLNLGDARIADVVAFLQTLTEKKTAAWPPPKTAVCR